MKPSGFYLGDCMDAMREFPDKFFDLAIVDPPYRNREDNDGTKAMRAYNSQKSRKDMVGDKPNKDYFEELFRITKNQIVWGANNFIEELKNTNCFLFWYKNNPMKNYSDGELAWTSFNGVARCINIPYFGTLNADKDSAKIHPTQKPVALYLWLLQNYAHRGDKILDTHVGSASSLIACHRMGFEYWGMELDADYYKAANERLEREKAMQPLFAPEEIYKPQQQGLDFEDKE